AGKTGPMTSSQPAPLEDESGLSKFARGAAAVLFGANIPRTGRATRTAQLAGQLHRRQDELAAMKALGPLLRYAQEPSKAAQAIMPDYPIPDVGRVPGGAGLKLPTAWSTLWAA